MSHRRNFSNERLSAPGAGGSSMFPGYSQAAVVNCGLLIGQLINAVGLFYTSWNAQFS
jgi:hypothetical protein